MQANIFSEIWLTEYNPLSLLSSVHVFACVRRDAFSGQCKVGVTIFGATQNMT